MRFKNRFIILKTILFALIVLISCNVNQNDKSSKQQQLSQKANNAGFPSNLLGNYHGVQKSYFLKNQNGEDLVINGNKVPVPSCDYNFLLKENNVISLQQTKLEDHSQIFYEGKFKIVKDVADVICVECSLSDGQYSNPNYSLTINKVDKTATCFGNNEPEIHLEKLN